MRGLRAGWQRADAPITSSSRFLVEAVAEGRFLAGRLRPAPAYMSAPRSAAGGLEFPGWHLGRL